MTHSLVIALTLAACSTEANDLSPDVFGVVQQPTGEAPDTPPELGNDQGDDQGHDNVADRAPPILQFAPERNIWWDAHTLAIAPNGRQAIMGMYYGDYTCWYDPDSGYLGDEKNYTDCDDDVLLFSSTGSLLTVGWECDDVRRINVGSQQQYDVPGLLSATFAADDVVALSYQGTCTLSRFAADGSGTKSILPTSVCEAAPELVGDTERVLLVAGGKLWHVDGDQLSVLAEDVRSGAVDRNTGDLLVSSRSAPEHLRALDAEGKELWERTLAGAVRGIQALGDRGGWMMHVASDDATPGTMLAVSGVDGSTWAEGVAWPGITDWEVSHDGGLLAVAVDDRVVYQYRILDND